MYIDITNDHRPQFFKLHPSVQLVLAVDLVTCKYLEELELKIDKKKSNFLSITYISIN